MCSPGCHSWLSTLFISTGQVSSVVLEVCLWCCSLLACGVRWHKSPHSKRDLCQMHCKLASLLNQCRLQQMCHLLKSTFRGACALITHGSTFFAAPMQRTSVDTFGAVLQVQLTKKCTLLLRSCWLIFLVYGSRRDRADLHQCCYRSLKKGLNSADSRWY